MRRVYTVALIVERERIAGGPSTSKNLTTAPPREANYACEKISYRAAFFLFFSDLKSSAPPIGLHLLDCRSLVRASRSLPQLEPQLDAESGLFCLFSPRLILCCFHTVHESTTSPAIVHLSSRSTALHRRSCIRQRVISDISRPCVCFVYSQTCEIRSYQTRPCRNLAQSPTSFSLHFRNDHLFTILRPEKAFVPCPSPSSNSLHWSGHLNNTAKLHHNLMQHVCMPSPDRNTQLNATEHN